ncbi:F-actin-capping protein subunit beta [Microtus ochrogaster]|uniref:F-actin-capping protein subunit beta n=1 Tax=Microtus ochrogaster TaxID=79684 RepID=A0A8J6KUE4_MICOH|nr:F-actin-capping protein subunit beta [Microtus ochrogaster]
MHPNRRSLPFPLNCQLVRVGTADYGGASDQSDQQLDCALDLMRRLPPQQIEKNLSDLIDLVPSLCEDLLSSVDQPLKIARDKVVGKDYLLCDYNRDGDSYRSPWSNKYDPPLEDGAMPSARLRKLEVEANNAFDQYRDLSLLRDWLAIMVDVCSVIEGSKEGSRMDPFCSRYFEGGVSSVYLWDLDHGFAGVILIKKAGDGSKKIKGCWDSIHVVEVQEKSSGRTAHYKLTSTVMLWLQTNKSGSGTMNLGGSLTRQMEKDETVSDCSPHIANIGRLVEDMENKIRSTLNEIYFGKTKDIVNGLRSVQTFADKSKQEALKNDLVEALKRKQQC